jgi:hypothetical protein
MHRTFERRNVMLEVIALARKQTLCPRDCRISAFDECSHCTLHILRFCSAGDRPWHSEQCCISPRDPFFVRNADLELHARVLVEVVQARDDRL